MTQLSSIFKTIVTAVFVTFLYAVPLSAQADKTETLDQLYTELLSADDKNWQQIEKKIWAEWSRSGSDSMDLLLERGRKAMSAGDFGAAIEHLTALTDHAPDFAEGWNARATAYYQSGLYGPSIKDIGRVLTLNPRHFGAISGLALILEQIGKQEEALQAYREVEAIHPHRANLQEAIERLERKVGGTDL